MVELSSSPRAAAIGLAVVALATLTAAGVVRAAPHGASGPPTDAARSAALTHARIFAGVEDSEQAPIRRR